MCPHIVYDSMAPTMQLHIWQRTQIGFDEYNTLQPQIQDMTFKDRNGLVSTD